MNWLISMLFAAAKNYLVKNWRTTVVAIVAAICFRVPSLQPYKEQIIEIALPLGLLLAKDGSTTGVAAAPEGVRGATDAG